MRLENFWRAAADIPLASGAASPACAAPDEEAPGLSGRAAVARGELFRVVTLSPSCVEKSVTRITTRDTGHREGGGRPRAAATGAPGCEVGFGSGHGDGMSSGRRRPSRGNTPTHPHLHQRQKMQPAQEEPAANETAPLESNATNETVVEPPAAPPPRFSSIRPIFVHAIVPLTIALLTPSCATLVAAAAVSLATKVRLATWASWRLTTTLFASAHRVVVALLLGVRRHLPCSLAMLFGPLVPSLIFTLACAQTWAPLAYIGGALLPGKRSAPAAAVQVESDEPPDDEPDGAPSDRPPPPFRRLRLGSLAFVAAGILFDRAAFGSSSSASCSRSLEEPASVPWRHRPLLGSAAEPAPPTVPWRHRPLLPRRLLRSTKSEQP